MRRPSSSSTSRRRPGQQQPRQIPWPSLLRCARKPSNPFKCNPFLFLDARGNPHHHIVANLSLSQCCLTCLVSQVAVALCLLVPGAMHSTLFPRVFPLYRLHSSRAAGCTALRYEAPLLEALEQRVLANQVQVLAPEVMQVRGEMD